MVFFQGDDTVIAASPYPERRNASLLIVLLPLKFKDDSSSYFLKYGTH